jgi:hypothetical protein
LSTGDYKGFYEEDKGAKPHHQEQIPSCRFHRNQYIFKKDSLQQ